MVLNNKSGTEVEIQGQVQRITYCNEESGFTIAKVKVPGDKNLLTISGNFPVITPGETLRIKGVWFNHPKYGEQIKVSSCITVIPSTAKGIEKYLGSGLIKGIGPVLAKRLVARFGLSTLDVIDSYTERLGEVEGIGDKRVDMIKLAWQEQREVKDIMLFLQSNGVSPAYAVKIFKRYGTNAIGIVRTNPYRLAGDIYGIGFMTADKIAEKMGFDKNSPLRIEAGIIYVANRMADAGHVYYPLGLLLQECVKVLSVDATRIAEALSKIASDKKIVVEDLAKTGAAIDDKAVYLAKYHLAECGVADFIKRLLSSPKPALLFNVDECLHRIQKEFSITLADAQKEAVKRSLSEKVLVITGGPGTGKTTIINSIINIYLSLGRRVLLTAPTGRAAKRMSESTHHDAKTIHRLLEFNPTDGGFKRNDKNPLVADIVVVDEASMVDTLLMYQFLKAVPQTATLVLVGDTDQLPSVGAGNVLRDIISSRSVATVRLNEIFRQSRQSMIVVNAHRVNTGEMPYMDDNLEKARDFCFINAGEPGKPSKTGKKETPENQETPEKPAALDNIGNPENPDGPENIVGRIITLCKTELPRKLGVDPMKDIQVITAMHRGSLGASNLNGELQKALNDSPNGQVLGGRLFKVGDKLMQIVNNYDKDVYNGDIGLIESINVIDQEIVVNFDGKPVVYDNKDLDELTLAYAISVHKSQGSEYPVVIMPVHTQQYVMLQRNLLYTGITRGKRMVVLIGTKKAVAIAIGNNTPQKRYTHLGQRLRGD